MTKESECTLAISTKNNDTRASRPFTLLLPKRGKTMLYDSQDGMMRCWDVKNGEASLVGSTPIPQNSWAEFKFSRLSQSKQIHEGGGLIAYHGSDGLHYCGSRAGTPSENFYARDEEEEEGTGDGSIQNENGETIGGVIENGETNGNVEKEGETNRGVERDKETEGGVSDDGETKRGE